MRYSKIILIICTAIVIISIGYASILTKSNHQLKTELEFQRLEAERLLSEKLLLEKEVNRLKKNQELNQN
jgi:hypothetical protein